MTERCETCRFWRRLDDTSQGICEGLSGGFQYRKNHCPGYQPKDG